MKLNCLLIPVLAISLTLMGSACSGDEGEFEATPDAAQSSDVASAEDADEDGSGEVDAGPCGGDCAAPTPVCEESSGECVACVGDDDCTDGVCADDNTCVACLGDGDCDEGVCDTDANACVECVDDAQCDGETPACDVDNNECVQCVEHAQCAEVGASACGDDNTCQACAASEECGHLDDTPATNNCTNTPVATLGTCEPCKADSECEPDHRCVPMEFDGQALDDGFCLQQASSGCERPYGGGIVSRESLSGAAADSYCGIAESLTSCAAVLDLKDGESCSSDDQCGQSALNDGRCETVNGATGRCTYSCSVTGDCPTGRDCDSEVDTSDYCGGGVL